MIPVTKRNLFWQIAFKDILKIICAATVPIALTIFTSITNRQGHGQTESARQSEIEHKMETRQQILYDDFLNNIYELDNDGHLDEDKSPWAFANAFFQAAHREWDAVRKADTLQFLKEQQLIGRSISSTQCVPNLVPDIIRLNDLNFDGMKLTSPTGTINGLKLDCVVFNQVTMRNAAFLNVNLDGTSFKGGMLAKSKFIGTSLIGARFHETILKDVDFGDSDLTNAEFVNVDLSNVKLTPKQSEQAKFYNTTMPNGTVSRPKPTITTNSSSSKTTPATAIVPETIQAPRKCRIESFQTHVGTCVDLPTAFNCSPVGTACGSQNLNEETVLFSGVKGSYDDDETTFSVPFNVSLYGVISTNVGVSTNGVVCMDMCATATGGSIRSNAFAHPAVFAYFTDLKVYADTSQNISYAITGSAPSRILTINFYIAHTNSSNWLNNFQVILYEAIPNVVRIDYHYTHDSGVTASIGTQKSMNGFAMRYSSYEAMIANGTSLLFNTYIGMFSR